MFSSGLRFGAYIATTTTSSLTSVVISLGFGPLFLALLFLVELENPFS